MLPSFFRLSFCFFDNVLSCTNTVNVDSVQSNIFSFVAHAFDVISKIPLPNPSSRRFIPLFSCKTFIILAHILIHFEFILTVSFGEPFLNFLDKSHLVIVYYLFNMLIIVFVNILLRILKFIFIKDISCSFLFLSLIAG